MKGGARGSDGLVEKPLMVDRKKAAGWFCDAVANHVDPSVEKGGDMKTMLTGTIVFLGLVLMGVLPAMGQQAGQDQMEGYYGTYIDTLILKFDARAERTDSKLHNVRHAAEMAGLKAAFLRENKQALVRELMASDAGLKGYKIDYFVNGAFFAEVRDQGTLTAEAYGRSEPPAAGAIQMARENYAAYIEACIRKCEKKTLMVDSRSRNLQSGAEQARMKAAFLRDYRDQLIDDLVYESVELKPYKLDYLINRRFFEVLRSQDPALAGATY